MVVKGTTIERVAEKLSAYPDGYMDIQLNLVDEIQELMETLRRESCTA